MARRHKLPFSTKLERKYNEVNIENFVKEWEEFKEDRQERTLNMNNDLHIELGKFGTYDVSFDEIVDLAIRYALNKQEFRKLSAQLIELKQ